MSEAIVLDLLKKHKGTENFYSPKANRLHGLTYRNLSVEEFGNSDIPDENFSTCDVTGLRDAKSYDFCFTPPHQRTFSEIGNKRYRVINAPKNPSQLIIGGQGERVDNRWVVDKKGLKRVVDDFLKLVPNVGKIKPVDDDDPEDCTCGLINPQMDMTQKGIAQILRRIDDDLGFYLVTVRFAHYTDLVPKDKSSKNLGFNLPANKIWDKTWSRVYE